MSDQGSGCYIRTATCFLYMFRYFFGHLSRLQPLLEDLFPNLRSYFWEQKPENEHGVAAFGNRVFENSRCMSKTCYTFRSSRNTFRPRVERDLEGLTEFAEQLVGPGTDSLTLNTQTKSRSRKRSRRTGPFALITPKVSKFSLGSHKAALTSMAWLKVQGSPGLSGGCGGRKAPGLVFSSRASTWQYTPLQNRSELGKFRVSSACGRWYCQLLLQRQNLKDSSCQARLGYHRKKCSLIAFQGTLPFLKQILLIGNLHAKVFWPENLNIKPSQGTVRCTADWNGKGCGRNWRWIKYTPGSRCFPPQPGNVSVPSATPSRGRVT